MVMDIIFASLCGLVVLAFGVLVLVDRYRKTHPMKEWKHYGLPPADVEIALAVIKEHVGKLFPEQKRDWRFWFGGKIVWVDEPYMACGKLVAGTVENFLTPQIKAVRFLRVWQTALAHEILHIYWYRLSSSGTKGEEEASFITEVNATNAEIEKRLLSVL